MYKIIFAFGLCLFYLAGCVGRGYTWLSESEVEFYENYRGAAYYAILDGPDVDNTLYSITGQDAAQFVISAPSGEVQFQRSPDYENPQDVNGDNRYEITVIATDETTGKQHSTVDISITVKDAESVSATKLFPLANSYVEPNGDGIVPIIITIDDLYAPVFYPDDWHAVDSNITRFFNYPQPFFQFEPNFTEESVAVLLDSKRYNDSDTLRLKQYYSRKFLPPFEVPMLFNYGYLNNPSEKITVAYSNKSLDQAAPVELEWHLKNELSDPPIDFIEQPRKIAVSKETLYFASDKTLWRMGRDGTQLTQVYSTEGETIEKIAVINERLLVLFREDSALRWRLAELISDEVFVHLYGIDGLSHQVLGTDYDVEILYLESAYTVAFLPDALCRENSEGVAETTMYRFNAAGSVKDTALLTNLNDALFKCQNGLLVDTNSVLDLEYDSPRMSYNPSESSLYYWGRRYSDDQINGVTTSNGPSSLTIGSEYSLDASVDRFSEYQHFFRSFNERTSMYLNGGGLFVASGHIDADATRISSEDYLILHYAVDTSADLIYSVGYWGGVQGPTLAVHHFYSGAASYIPLTLTAD